MKNPLMNDKVFTTLVAGIGAVMICTQIVMGLIIVEVITPPPNTEIIKVFYVAERNNPDRTIILTWGETWRVYRGHWATSFSLDGTYEVTYIDFSNRGRDCKIVGVVQIE